MSKLDKIKTHFRENKKLYVGIAIGGGVAVVGFAVYSVTREKYVGATAINIGYKNTIEQHIEVHIEALGDPGNIIQDTTTGTIYASQNQAARELGVDHRRISKHLQGLTDNVDGHKFNLLGKASVST